MIEITPSIRKRFCKDFNLPIALFDEPYFSERLAVVDRVIPCIDDWDNFVSELRSFQTEQDYFEYYNKVKDTAIQHLKDDPAYIRFNNSEPPVISRLNKANLYSETNHDKYFISIDMRKANFSALRHYDPKIFDDKETWEDWLGQFTDMKHIIRSKYIRQVIMGACNPKRQIQYETKLMLDLYEKLKENLPKELQIFCINSDELVYAFTEPIADEKVLLDIWAKVSVQVSDKDMFRVELFRIESLGNSKGYIKHIVNTNEKDYKCISAEEFHIIIKDLLNIPLTENDKVFRYNGRLAKYID